MSETYNDVDGPELHTTHDGSLTRVHDLGLDQIATHSSPETNSICHLFESCTRRYETLLLALQTATTRSTHSAAALVPEVKDEFSRLRVWGEQTHAVLPQNARRSLDEQLRGDAETKEIASGTLRRLNNHIERAIQQIERHSSTSDVDSESEEYSSSSGEDDTAQESLESVRDLRLRKIINSISESIRSLYRISVLLRFPRKFVKYLGSDYAHVLEKIRQWRHLTIQSKIGGDVENLVIQEGIQLIKEDPHREIADIAFFCRRLTGANIFRREQFEHWIDCPDVPESREGSSDTGARTDQLKIQTSSTLRPSVSTVAKSALGGDGNEDQWHTHNAISVTAKSDATRVPDVPRRSETDPSFECPFCHIILDSQAMQEREVWKKHVFRDLRPYVCSFEHCPDPGRLFIDRHDWVYHEQQMHRRKWICLGGCANELTSKADMVQHLLTEHSSTVDKRQVTTYADMCERQMDDTAPDACLICLEQMSLFRLQSHLATHMEDIALMVLPLIPDDDEGDLIEGGAEDNARLQQDDYVPVFPRISRVHLDVETLEHYDVPWKWDPASPDHMILLRELDHYETDVLFEHTRRSRQQVSSTASLSGPVNDNFPEDKDQSIENPATSTMEGSPECDSPSSYDVVYTCINHRDLDIQTVEHYGLSWEWDRSSPGYIVIFKELDEYEVQVLLNHTRRRRQADDSRHLESEEECHALGVESDEENHAIDNDSD